MAAEISEVTEQVSNLNISPTPNDSHKKNRIQVSNTKKPLFFYVNLAKRYMQQHGDVELSALGMGDWVFPGGFPLSSMPLVLLYPVDPQNWFRHREACTPEKSEAIATVVTIAEILKNNGLAVEKKITTSTVDMKDDSRQRPIQKAKIEIVLGKTENFDELMAAAAEERELADEEEQS
ncbi:hypothetical protein IFM89_022052 [Coptis chinensis]|uniref:Alba DNA/RNA-binding protein n=1 Tax=Coptis chinensis TaxID=261450 RepID=A0A835IEE8_9MAGN|nr:hypothetical protein IFM89_022052 [Coptis chinensis]